MESCSCPMCASMQMLQLSDNGTRVISYDYRKNIPTADVPCPICRHPKVTYIEIHSRSADEPMTIFFACLNEDCKHRWSD